MRAGIVIGATAAAATVIGATAAAVTVIGATAAAVTTAVAASGALVPSRVLTRHRSGQMALPSEAESPTGRRAERSASKRISSVRRGTEY
jgi:hypothetical protein